MPNGDVSRPMSSWRGQLTTCNSFPASPETPGEEEGTHAERQRWQTDELLEREITTCNPFAASPKTVGEEGGAQAKR